jgi:hypothetical protein
VLCFVTRIALLLDFLCHYEMAGKPYERVASEAVEDFDDTEDGDKSLKVPWNTGVWARFPLVGLSCLFMVIASAVGALVVLLLSNGQSQDQ